MILDTYRNNSDNNTLNKSLTSVESNITITLKDDTEIIAPTLILSNNVNQNFNYFYLSEFNRYYFVTSRTYSQQRYIVRGKVDPLMSFKSDIEDLSVIANRSSSRFNLYQTDGEISFLNKNDIITLAFPGGFTGYSMILAVNGGAQLEEE